jgi:serine/threonine protein kinase/tetratricopeptide (TPR) repeat protein
MLQPPNAVDALSYVPPLDPLAPLRAALRGHYEIEREIGQGAFATVYLARDLKHERKVALKVLNADPTSETGELRFIREIRVLARLQHPNILPLHDSGHVDALLYYVMPYVTGETLRGRIDREKQLPVEAACSIAREVAEALGYAHAQGIIHRDIKPENILLSAGHPVLADFGIARVIDVAGVMQLTKTGMGSPGTPAYMSPEQLMGDKVLDGRSDTYSLGCVLFEMLTGKPPFAGKEGFVRRFTEPPPRTSSFRRNLPSHVDEIIGRALARAPGDRYQTAEEFAADLFHPERAHAVETPSSTSGPGVAASFSPAYAPDPPQLAVAYGASVEPLPAQPRVAPRWMQPSEWVRTIVRHPRVTAATALSLVLASLALEQNSRSRFYGALGIGPAVDSTRIVLLPLAGTATVRDRTRVTEGIYSALSEWRGLNVARDQDVNDEIRASGAPASTHSAAQLAKKLRAARFIWGQVTAGDSLNGRIELYDLNTDTPLNSVTIAGVLDGPKIAQAARELLEIPGRPHFADGGDGRTTSYPAWTAYGRGHLALQNGDLSTAKSAFRAAINADPDFGPAHLWLAQSLAWESPEARQDWRDDVAQALRAESGLSSRDRLVATALSHMAERQYPQACASYSQLTSADSLDFVGLYGLGQCHAFDSLVVRAVGGGSGWQFRSRYSDAATAYMKALSVNPAAHAMLPFAQVQDLLPVSSTKTRRGKNAAGEEFAAYPALIKDTVIFVPYPLPRFAELSPRSTIVAQGAALARNLDLLLEFASEWTRESPRSSAAYQALADVLEARGEINRSRSGSMSAVQAIEKARQLAANSRDSLLAASSEAWLLFKEGEFGRAREVADSLLKTLRNATPEEATAAIGLAALTGKIGKTAELSRLAPAYAASAAGLPIPVMDAAAAFFAFSALGVCGDTTTRLERRLDDQITHYVAEDQQLQISTAVKARPLSMQTPCTSGRATLGIQSTGNKLMKMQQALASSDFHALKSLLVSVSNEGRAQRPGDIALDFTYQVAWLRAASGDTAEAARQLDRALGSLPSLSASSVREPASAASAGRSMVLRAEIAAARGDVENRRKWAGALVDLWSTADSPLQPVVARMRLLAAPDHRR